MNLTYRDIDTILEALSTWEKAPMNDGFQDAIFSSLLTGMLGKDSPDYETEKRRNQKKQEELQLSSENKARQRRETSILLQAKLISYRNELQTKEIQ